MKQIFKKYFQSVLSPDEFEQFCDYIKKQDNSRSIATHLKSEWDRMLLDTDDQKGNTELLRDIQQQVLAEDRTKAIRKLKFYNIGLRIAAVLLIGSIITSIWLYQQSQSAFNSIPTQTVSIPYGARTQMAMPDGSKVWINAGSRLTYSNDFSKKREVQLVGEAFFDVVKGKIPFEVKTSYGTVHVMGTAFNVQAYPDGNFVTTLERGAVKVTDKENKQQQIISPGEQVRLSKDSFITENVNTNLYTSWKDGELIFSKEPFPSMIKRIERWYNVQIEFSSSDFEGLWFTGTIEGETVTEVMDMICKAAPVSYTYNTQERTIKITSKKRLKNK